MQNRIHTFFRSQGAVLRYLVALFALVFNVFFVRAQEHSRVRVNYPFDSSVLSSQYMQNASALARLDSLAALAEEGYGLEVVSFSSFK